jgi:hypothetical protein
MSLLLWDLSPPVRWTRRAIRVPETLIGLATDELIGSRVAAVLALELLCF